MLRSCTSRIIHSQNGNGLVCGLSTRKIFTPCSTQNSTTSRSAYQSAGQRVAVEVDVDDVLVFLRRVLGVLDGAVGPPVEPFRMLLDPGMVGRALDGEVERDLQPVLVRGRDQPREILEACRARDGCASWPPSVGADGIGAAGIVRAGGQAVVACPCGWCGRSDGSAGSRARRSRGRARRAARAITSSKVPCRSGVVAHASAGTARTRREARPLAVDDDLAARAR